VPTIHPYATLPTPKAVRRALRVVDRDIEHAYVRSGADGVRLVIAAALDDLLWGRGSTTAEIRARREWLADVLEYETGAWLERRSQT
jgi:hypothetical protein